MTHVVAVLDANVLIASATRDTLLRAAEAGLYTPLWSAEILDEVERNLVEHKMSMPEPARRLIVALAVAFPYALVQGYTERIDSLIINKKDRHVLAAGIQAGASIIVTQNLSDFPVSALQPYGIQAVSTDDFLLELLFLDPVTMAQIIQRQAASLLHPPMTVDEVLNSIAVTAPTFANLVRDDIQK